MMKKVFPVRRERSGRAGYDKRELILRAEVRVARSRRSSLRWLPPPSPAPDAQRGIVISRDAQLRVYWGASVHRGHVRAAALDLGTGGSAGVERSDAFFAKFEKIRLIKRGNRHVTKT